MDTSQLNPDPKLRPLCRGCPLPAPLVAVHPPPPHHSPQKRHLGVFACSSPTPPAPPPQFPGREAFPHVTPVPVPNLLVSAGPEDGQDEHRGDGRSQGAGDSLDVDVELAAAGALQDGEPDHAEDHQHHRDHPARDSGDTRAIAGHRRGWDISPGVPRSRGWCRRAGWGTRAGFIPPRAAGGCPSHADPPGAGQDAAAVPCGFSPVAARTPLPDAARLCLRSGQTCPGLRLFHVTAVLLEPSPAPSLPAHRLQEEPGAAAFPAGGGTRAGCHHLGTVPLGTTPATGPARPWGSGWSLAHPAGT